MDQVTEKSKLADEGLELIVSKLNHHKKVGALLAIEHSYEEAVTWETYYNLKLSDGKYNQEKHGWRYERRGLPEKRKKIIRNTNKTYEDFENERKQRAKEREDRHQKLIAMIGELNKVMVDPTFLFVIRDYGDFYTIQVFEGLGRENDQLVILGDENTLSYEIPVRRRTVKTLAAIEGYISGYYNLFIKAAKELAEKVDGIEIVKQTNYIKGLADENKLTEYRTSRAVKFTTEMMVYWQKYRLLPIIRTLENGKRYNRSVHSQKVVNALKNNNFFQQDDHFIVYWT